MLYEEAIAAIKYKNYSLMPLTEQLARVNTKKQITRRHFFKPFAALVEAFVANKIENLNTKRNEEGKKALENEIAYLSKVAQESPNSAFGRYFGLSHTGLIARVEGQFDVSYNSLQNLVTNQRVGEAFMSVCDNGRAYLKSLKGYFADGVPEDLGRAATQALIKERIHSLSSKENARSLGGILLEGAAIAGTMALVLTPAELINSKFK